MLHALAATALCLFIGERLVRYWSAWRLRRATKRGLAMLHPATLPQPEQERRRDTYVTVCLCAGFVGLMLAIAFH